MFISFEGIEGCGKTTQLEMLRDHLEWKGKSCVVVREPGGTELGERIRNILLVMEDEAEGIEPWAELFLYSASRAQLVKNVIKPCLEDGKVVLCDRFTDSTLAYQGYGRGLDIDAIKTINSYSTFGITPDVTILIDCPVETGLKRAWHRIKNSEGATEDRFEREAIEFHQRVRRGYLELAQKEPQRIRVVDGTGEISVIHGKICDIIDKVI